MPRRRVSARGRSSSRCSSSPPSPPSPGRSGSSATRWCSTRSASSAPDPAPRSTRCHSFTPNGDCRYDRVRIRFRTTRSDDATVQVVKPGGGSSSPSPATDSSSATTSTPSTGTAAAAAAAWRRPAATSCGSSCSARNGRLVPPGAIQLHRSPPRTRAGPASRPRGTRLERLPGRRRRPDRRRRQRRRDPAARRPRPLGGDAARDRPLPDPDPRRPVAHDPDRRPAPPHHPHPRPAALAGAVVAPSPTSSAAGRS